LFTLRQEVAALRETITKLDRDLIKTTGYVKVLLTYMETLMPEGSNRFIEEMAKEIRSYDKAGNTTK
jgi:hypothetical protein